VLCFLPSQFFSAVSLQCLPYPPFCNNFDLLTETCKGCLPGYQILNKVCVPVCLATQVLINGICYNLPFKCLELNTFLQCARCEAGYSNTLGVPGVCTLIVSGPSSSSGSNSGSSSGSSPGSSSGTNSGSSSGSNSGSSSSSNSGSSSNSNQIHQLAP